MAEIISTTFQLKRGLANAWKRNNPILAPGEPGWTIDTHVLKIGDGVTPWNILDAVSAEAAIARAAEEANAKEITRVDNALKAAIENDGQGLDSIKELATWIEEHGTEASDMAKAIEENANAIGAIYTPASDEGDAASGVLVTEIARIESAYKTDDQATLTAAKNYVDGEIAKLHSVDNDTIKVNEENKSYVAKVSTDILEQGEMTLVFCAGTASTVI